MDDAELNTLELLRHHNVMDVKEVHNYVGEIDGLGAVRIKVMDAGATHHDENRWLVEVYDELDTRRAQEQAERLPLAIAAAFRTLEARLG
jgi:hypothetical protein